MENDFGRFLSEKRKEACLTQQELADKLFVSSSTISKWEKNKANPDISMITTLAKILHVTEHELITASEDVRERRNATDAKKWNALSGTFNMFFLISYALALITCFICNLAVNKTLSWFFIVLSAIALSASFTTLPRYVKKYKLLIITVTELLLTVILLAVCCSYTGGSWFMVASIPVVCGFLIIFLPIYFKVYNIFSHRALIVAIIDVALILIVIFEACIYTGGTWFFSFALPVTLFSSIILFAFVFVCRYVKTTKLLKASILVFAFIPYLISAYFFIKRMLKVALKIDAYMDLTLPNLSNWSTGVMISSNVMLLMGIALIVTSLILLLINYINKKRR